MAVNKSILYYVANYQLFQLNISITYTKQRVFFPHRNGLAYHDKQLKNTLKLYELSRIHLVNHLCEDSQKLYPICCFIFAKIANLVLTPLSNYFSSLWTSSVHLFLIPTGKIYLIFKPLSSILEGLNLCICLMPIKIILLHFFKS